MNKSEIKKANRKAMPKFILIVAISSIIGATIGFFSAKYGLSTLSDSLKTAGTFFGTYIAPWLTTAIAVIVPVISVPLYKNAKRQLSAWDGENENIYDTVDKKLSVIMWLANTSLILSFFLIAASYSSAFSDLKPKGNILVFVGIAAFFGILIESVILQQKCVDTVKIMNPEKTASVYDTKFQKKWVDSCDEAEKIMIGKCAFKAYSATNIVCTILTVVLAVYTIVFETGFLPSLAVCVIWLVNQSAYFKEALKFSKTGNKIS
ncbi:MAG: DUF3169 family protein [Oscillospiraceae bacterium]|nr:DUF3169 family protein [Oscillospiraceae bacterium]